MGSLTDLEAWKKLEEHKRIAEKWHMRQLFEKDPKRFEKFR